jgi:S1-C subfamily serine protease
LRNCLLRSFAVLTLVTIPTFQVWAGLIPPFFLDSVVAIGYRPLNVAAGVDGKSEVRRGPFVPVGSGFLYGHFLKKVNDELNEYAYYLVTNQHVVEDVERAEKQQVEAVLKTSHLEEPQKLFLRFNPKAVGPAREDLWVPLNPSSPALGWSVDKGTDLAVVRVAADFLDKAGLQYAVFQSDIHVADRSKAGEIGLTEGDGVYVLGFPMGLVGGERNFVIARQGSIARIRDCLAGSTNRFLIDALVFPGNSGGPVVSRPDMTYVKGTKKQDRAYVVGVVRAFIPYQDVGISQQTGRPRITFEENSGLAEVIPMDFVKMLIEQYEKSLAK